MSPKNTDLRYRRVFVALTGAFLLTLVGCQRFSLRPDLPQFYEEDMEDDWAPPLPAPTLASDPSGSTASNPKTNRWGMRMDGQVPRVILPRDRKSKANNQEQSVVRTSSTGQPSSADAPGATVMNLRDTVTTGNASDKKSGPSSSVVGFGGNPSGAPGPLTQPMTDPSPSVADTGLNDLDIEGALQNLPSEYREVVRRTLTAIKNGDSQPGHEPKSESQQQPVANSVTNPPSNATTTSISPPTTTAAPPQSSALTEKPSSSVSVRIADSELSVTAPKPQTSPLAKASMAATQDSAVTDAAGKLAADDKNAVVTTSSIEAVHPSSNSNDSKSPNPASVSWHQMTRQAIETLEHQIESSPPADESLRMSQEITLRMLYVSQRRLDDALRPIERLNENEQEYIRHQMQALYEASNPDANPARSRHWSIVMNSQSEATSHLAAVSDLAVRSVAFCTQVDGYGLFQRFAKNHFAPDQDVLLYCEIDNVAAEKVKLGYETQLQGRYEIRDAQGLRIEDQLLPMEPEICQNHRRDYFIVYRIYMPQKIAPGSYQLRLTVEDMKAHKFGQSNVDFEIRK